MATRPRQDERDHDHGNDEDDKSAHRRFFHGTVASLRIASQPDHQLHEPNVMGVFATTRLLVIGRYREGMFMTPMVNLYTKNIRKSLAFYRDLLGFVETFRTPLDGVPTHVELQLDNFTLALSSDDAAREEHGIEPSPGSPAMALVVWTNNVDESYRALVDVGVVTEQVPHDRGSNRTALLRDPDGNLVEIVSKTT